MRNSEMDVYVLAAGQQKRYGQHESKMMAPIEGRPAFAYTMDSLLSVFPRERISIITSEVFPDFNNFIDDTYPHSPVIVDNQPGKGTAHSLARTFPWNTDKAFVTDADIYYKPELIERHLNSMDNSPESPSIVTVTPKTEVAPTHRDIQVFPTLHIPKSADQESNPSYRNLGAHTVSASIENHWDGNTENLIDVLRIMHLAGEPVLSHIYLSAYLHMANKQDVQSWEKYFKNSQ